MEKGAKAAQKSTDVLGLKSNPLVLLDSGTM